MPVKVRCPSCEKVLNAPDAARGKAVRCPKCKSKVKIPTGRPKKPVAQAAAPDSTAFLLNLDAGSVEDSRSQICPKCGGDVSDEDIDCPSCGVNIETGVMSEAMRHKRSAKAGEARKFFQEMRSESWRFWKANTSLAFRTVVYLSLLSLVSFGCLYMVYWCVNAPPQTFWALCAFVFGVVCPGWILLLQIEIIRFSLDRKKKLKRINFDFFTSAALGVKMLLWMACTIGVVQIVTGTVAYFMLQSGQDIAAYALIGLGCLPAVLVFPIAASHMAMPVQYPAWMIHKLMMTFFRTWKGVVYWFVFVVATNIPALACFGVLGAVYSSDVKEFLDGTSYNQEVKVRRSKVERKKDEIIPDARTQRELDAAGTPTELQPSSLIVPGLLWLAGCTCFGLMNTFNMRSTGLYALYFRRDLDLIAREKETTYVSRSQDNFVAETESNVSVVWILLVLCVVGSVAFAIASGALLLAVIGALFAAIIFVPMAGLWRIFEKAGEPGWGAVSPKYISNTLLKTAGYDDWYWVLLLAVPGLGQWVWYKAWIVMAKRFQKSASFGVGLAFFGIVFYPLLGFGTARCLKPQYVEGAVEPKKKADDKRKKTKKKPK